MKSDVKWKWTPECDDAMIKAKQLVGSAPVLAHYDPKLPIEMAGDASAYGIGAVLSHICPDGEQPMAFASRTLSNSKKNYSQIEKETLTYFWNYQISPVSLWSSLYTDDQP